MPNPKTLPNQPRKKVVIKRADHPGAIFKVTCPKCRRSFAVKANSSAVYRCQGCGRQFTSAKL